MPTSSFDFAYTLARNKLDNLKRQMEAGNLPDVPAFQGMRKGIEQLGRVCPPGQEGRQRELEDACNDLERVGKIAYRDAIEKLLVDPAQLWQKQQQVNVWIDVFGRLFDTNLATQLRHRTSEVLQGEEARVLLNETRKQVQALWETGQGTGDAATAVATYQEALQIAQSAVRRAASLRAPGPTLTDLRALEREAIAKHDAVRRKRLGAITLDQAGRFIELIADFERIKDHDPQELVDYYPRLAVETYEPIPVSQALDTVHERWARFVADKAGEYRKRAEARLAANDPEGAHAAINELWKLDVPAPEVLLDPDRSPVDISVDGRTALASTLAAIEKAEADLASFRQLLDHAANESVETAWRLLVQAQNGFPQFAGKDSKWLKEQPGVLARYQSRLQDDLNEARASLQAGEYDHLRHVLDNVLAATAGQHDLEAIGRAARQFQQLAQYVQTTLQDVTTDLNTRDPIRARDAQSRLTALEERLKSEHLDGLQNIVSARARVDGAVRSDILLARVAAAASSNDLETLQEALRIGEAATETITPDRTTQLGSAVALLEAKLALVSGQLARERGDLTQAIELLSQAARHSTLQAEAAAELKGIAATQEADNQVRQALGSVTQQDPCQAVNTLRPLRELPTRLRRELNDALRDSEDRCRAALENQLTQVRAEASFDPEAALAAIEQIALLDAQRARQLERELKPIIADRKAQLDWMARRWAQARVEWETASQLAPAYHSRYLAALKQETLEAADLLMESMPQETANDLQHKLAQDLPSDAHLLFAMSRAHLGQTYAADWTDAEPLFVTCAQVAEQARRRAGEWRRRGLPDYEADRQTMLSTLDESYMGVDDLLRAIQELSERIVWLKRIGRRRSRLADYLDCEPDRKHGLVHALAAVQEHEKLQQDLTRDSLLLDEFRNWWQDLTDRTILTGITV